MSSNTDANQDRSLGELFAELMREVSTLVRQEVALAKTELSQKASHLGKDIGMMAAGGALAYAGLLAIIASLILMLTRAGLPSWASALLVGAVVVGAGGYLVKKGLSALKREDLAPKQTIETLKEDTRWVKEQIQH